MRQVLFREKQGKNPLSSRVIFGKDLCQRFSAAFDINPLDVVDWQRIGRLYRKYKPNNAFRQILPDKDDDRIRRTTLKGDSPWSPAQR